MLIGWTLERPMTVTSSNMFSINIYLLIMLGSVDHCISVNHWLDPRLGSIPIALKQTGPRQSEGFGTHSTFHHKQGSPLSSPSWTLTSASSQELDEPEFLKAKPEASSLW